MGQGPSLALVLRPSGGADGPKSGRCGVLSKRAGRWHGALGHSGTVSRRGAGNLDQVLDTREDSMTRRMVASVMILVAAGAGDVIVIDDLLVVAP